MIRMIESLVDFPTRFLPDEDYIGKFEPGIAVQLVTKNGVPCVQPSDGTRPIGVVGDSVGKEIYDLVPVWLETMIFRTDKILNEKFPPGSKLYVSRGGLFTSVRPFEDALYVGHVVSTIFDKGDKLIEVNWI